VALELGVTATSLPARAAASPFAYEVPDYPVATASCAAAARDLGARFAAATGLTVTRAACLSSTGTRSTLHIDYQADAKPSLATTGEAASTLWSAASYASETACTTALPAERAEFEQRTGLAPLVAYCLSDLAASGGDRWIARVDAFGEAAAAPRIIGAYVFGSPLGYTAATFRGAVLAALQSDGLAPRFATLRGMGGYTELTVGYYGGEDARMTAGTYARFDAEAPCRAEVAQLAPALGGATRPALLTYCAALFTGRIEAQALAFGDEMHPANAVERFATYADCAASRDALVARYRDDYQRPVTGGLCTLTDDRTWTVALVETAPH
jgi:hypothetical protein